MWTPKSRTVEMWHQIVIKMAKNAKMTDEQHETVLRGSCLPFGSCRPPRQPIDRSTLLAIGLILVKIDPFYESLFFSGVITFFLTYLLLLIRDLDNPFGYFESRSAEDISLKPLDDLIVRLQARSGRH